MKKYTLVFGLVVLWGAMQGSAWGLTLRVQGAQALPGDTPDVCVFLDGNDGTVSGLQVDLTWDSSCLSIDRSSGDQAACVMNPETGRSTFQTRVLASDRMRALMVSLHDTSPMPATVNQLFCCQFRVSAAAGGRTCGVTPANVVLSDPRGQRLRFTGVGGSITVARGRDEPGMGTGGVAPGGAMVPGVVQGGGSGGATAGGAGAPGEGGRAVAPAPAAVGGAPGGVPPVPAAAPVPAMPAAVQGAPAAVGTEGGATPEALAATPETPAQATPVGTPKEKRPTPAPTGPTKPAVAETPPKAATPSPEVKKTPAAGTPTAAAAVKTPHKKPKGRKSPTAH
ncbi:hypothetical protein HRbin30_02897 [bacterium HR30]|nr:hypothetical protein HRbin30_02897 [bacterium HR30]